jgi:hypothetical protein
MSASRPLGLLGLITMFAAAPARVQSLPEVAWTWSGAVTPTSATVKAAVIGEASGTTLWLSRDEGPAEPRRYDGTLQPSHYPSRNARSIAAFVLTGLEPDSSYTYIVEVEGRRASPGRFRTFPTAAPYSFSIAFAACAGDEKTGVSNHAVFEAIAQRRPGLFVHMGDLHYRNIGKGISNPNPDQKERLRQEFAEAFDDTLSQPRQAALYRSTPVAYTWDDHDFGDNNADRSSATQGIAQPAYRLHVPHYPLVDGATSIQQAFDIGRVRVIVTDSRSQRDEPSMLGRAQLDWLFGELRRAGDDRVPLVIWVNSVPWISHDMHGWKAFGDERRAIAREIARLGLVNRMLVLSGDAHMVAIDDGSHSNYAHDGSKGHGGGFPVVQAAPLDRKPSLKGGPYTVGGRKRISGPWSLPLLHWLNTFRKPTHQFGWLDLHDDGRLVTAKIEGRRYDPAAGSVPIDGMTLTMTCDAARCSW